MSVLTLQGAPYLERLRVVPERIRDRDRYPFSVPGIATLDLVLRGAVTFLVGENGSGKSTIIEGIAGLLDLPLSGGGTSDRGLRHGPDDDHDLGRALRPSFRRRPRDAYFFRGEFASHFANLLEERNNDPYFTSTGDPYESYGGKPLFVQSHGEGFLSVLQNRVRDGLYLLDEPEAALSPQRQLVLMMLIADRAERGAQFIIATHSPILMTIPCAEMLALAGGTVSKVALEDTEHFQLSRVILQDHASFWKKLRP